ncbi:MAG: alginate lyase family protein [Phycisphaerae bacterium]
MTACSLLLLSAHRLRAEAPLARQSPFVHPGILHSRAELDFIRAKVAAREEPWFSAWQALRNSPKSKLSWIPNPHPYIFRGAYNKPDIGAITFKEDGIAAYTHALEFALTGRAAHALKAIEILNAYARTLRTIQGHDARLETGEGSFHFLNAAEIIRSSSSLWPDQDQALFADLVRNRFLPIIKKPLPNYNGNWDAAIFQTKLAMAVYLEDHRLFNATLDWCANGPSNGAIPHYFMPTGECQESGRDQAHTQMGLGFLACACEVAAKQGVDLYATAGNRLAAGCEYVARYNLGNDVPYEPFDSFDHKYFNLSISEKSRGTFSPIYEKIYRHYHDQAGLDMPFTRQVLQKIRPEKESDSNSFAPWGTLMYAGVPTAPPPEPPQP